MKPKYRIYRQPDGRYIIKSRWLFFWVTWEHDYGTCYYSTVEDAEKDIARLLNDRDGPLRLVKEISA